MQSRIGRSFCWVEKDKVGPPRICNWPHHLMVFSWKKLTLSIATLRTAPLFPWQVSDKACIVWSTVSRKSQDCTRLNLRCPKLGVFWVLHHLEDNRNLRGMWSIPNQNLWLPTGITKNPKSFWSSTCHKKALFVGFLTPKCSWLNPTKRHGTFHLQRRKKLQNFGEKNLMDSTLLSMKCFGGVCRPETKLIW